MQMTKYVNIFLTGLLISLLLGTGRSFSKEDRSMVFAETTTVARNKPLLDTKIPSDIETATFAMG